MDKKLHDAMVNFQYLEFMLRGAIEKFECIIRDKASEFLIYPVDENKINKMALAKLAERYSTYTGDKEFKRRVDAVVRSRNHLAHVLFMRAEYLRDELQKELEQGLEDVLKHSEEASSLADDVVMRMQNIYFDPVENKWFKD